MASPLYPGDGAVKLHCSSSFLHGVWQCWICELNAPVSCCIGGRYITLLSDTKKKLAVPWKERGRLPLFLIMFLPLSAMTIYYMVKNGSMTYAFAAPAAATLLVGVAEETMFRRILYIRLLRLFRYQSFKKPLLISALLFSLLHAVNYFAGFPAQQVLMQLVTTFVAGLFYILMYDYTKNIYLMILMHFLWDYILLSGATKQIPVFGTAMGVLEVIQIIVLLALLYRKWKQIAKEAAT